jgi:hypothetical protein
MEKEIVITDGDNILTCCESVIIVPEKAVQEAGYIQMFTVKDSAHAKHEFHAMAQMAYFQYQDDELDIREIETTAYIASGGESFELVNGMVICRDREGEFQVIVHTMQNRKKLLEAAYRYCTRWVRLDI